jgi:hypothetical protein
MRYRRVAYSAGVIVFRALYLGGYDIVKEHYQLEHASRTTRFVAAQVSVLLRWTCTDCCSCCEVLWCCCWQHLH